MRVEIIEFFINNLKIEEFEGKRILEVGSKYVNGSIRPLIEKFTKPKEYIGIDIEKGKYVDIVLPAEKLIDYFGEEKFDVVISTETLEHVKDWRTVIENMKKVLKKGGYIYITTCTRRFPYHDYPFDFWRYEKEDMAQIFSDFEILVLEEESDIYGIFLKARKPHGLFSPINLNNISLYSIILGKRITFIPNSTAKLLKIRLKTFLYNAIVSLGKKFLKFLK